MSQNGRTQVSSAVVVENADKLGEASTFNGTSAGGKAVPDEESMRSDLSFLFSSNDDHMEDESFFKTTANTEQRIDFDDQQVIKTSAISNEQSSSFVPLLFTNVQKSEEQKSAKQLAIQEFSKLLKSHLASAEENRRWDVKSFDKDYFNKEPHMKVFVKTRRTEKQLTVDEKMYASIKYQFHLEADACQWKADDVIMARAKLMDVNTGEIVLKDINNKDTLKGKLENVMAKAQKSLKSDLLVQAQASLSYHRQAKEYAYVIEFVSAANKERVLLSVQSAAIKIYARKKNKCNYSKRKREVEARNVLPPMKRQRTANFNKYLVKMENLLDFQNTLSVEEQALASEILKEKLNKRSQMNIG